MPFLNYSTYHIYVCVFVTDLLLEELAFNSTGPESAPQKKESDTANTYGQVMTKSPLAVVV